jgi:hypothetical protein
MRKFLAPLLLTLALLLAYAAWPLCAAWQLRTAVKSRDLAGIEQRVDWPTLRANLKQTVAANLSDEKRNADAGAVSKVLRRTLGPMLAGRVIDGAVTPRTLARILSGRPPGGDAPSPPPTRGAGDDSEPVPDVLSPRRLRWAFFEAPTRFRIEVSDRRDPAKRVVTVLALQGLSWKLVDVYYRTPS